MAVRPMRPCNVPGCAELTQHRYCEAHTIQRGKQEYYERPAWHRLYNTKRWKIERVQYLSHNPLCVECYKKGEMTAAIVVDHIIDHKGNLQLFYDKSNWQALCKQCHDKKI